MFHHRPKTQQYHLLLIKLNLGDMPTMTPLFQENGNIYLVIIVTLRVRMIQKLNETKKKSTKLSL